MSLFNWLSKANPSIAGRFPAAKTPLLPDPNREKTLSDQSASASANAEIDKDLDVNVVKATKRRRSHFSYDANQRLKMARFANEHGLSAANRHFSSTLGHNVPISTIQSIRDSYRKKLGEVRDPGKILSLPTLRRGRPFLVNNEIDLRVRKHLLAIRDCGGRVNRRITIATGIGIVRVMRPSLLPERGGSLVLGRAWAESVLLRPVKAEENRKGGDGTSTHRTFAKFTESTHLRERR